MTSCDLWNDFSGTASSNFNIILESFLSNTWNQKIFLLLALSKYIQSIVKMSTSV